VQQEFELQVSHSLQVLLQVLAHSLREQQPHLQHSQVRRFHQLMLGMFG
jgi:hypothetical protein